MGTGRECPVTRHRGNRQAPGMGSFGGRLYRGEHPKSDPPLASSKRRSMALSLPLGRSAGESSHVDQRWKKHPQATCGGSSGGKSDFLGARGLGRRDGLRLQPKQAHTHAHTHKHHTCTQEAHPHSPPSARPHSSSSCSRGSGIRHFGGKDRSGVGKSNKKAASTPKKRKCGGMSICSRNAFGCVVSCCHWNM